MISQIPCETASEKVFPAQSPLEWVKIFMILKGRGSNCFYIVIE